MPPEATDETLRAKAEEADTMEDTVAVIMAGGVGQRFWPLSTAVRPKQFLDLEGCGSSLLQATFARLLSVVGSADRIVVVTGERYRAMVHEQLPQLATENLLVEPVGRDTAPATALAALELRARFGNPVMGLFPADHRVGDPVAFCAAVADAVVLARRTSGLVTIGVKPDRPATAYGYIKRGKDVGLGFEVERFVEKPDCRRAEMFLRAGDYCWNSGIFLWMVDSILSELDRHAPDVLTPLARAHRDGTIADCFPSLPKISIDYAVMEETERAYVLPAEFGWDDIGDWNALERLLGRRAGEADTVVGHFVGLATSGNIVFTEDEEDLVVALGVEDLVIVKRGNAVLLVRRDRVQDIKQLLKDERLTSYLVPRANVAISSPRSRIGLNACDLALDTLPTALGQAIRERRPPIDVEPRMLDQAQSA
jgi:mannose-1-phosphate guanylyltransferase